MKKNRANAFLTGCRLAACGAALAAGAAFGAVDDTLIAFSTPGPDTYANDGTVVRDGEVYALVFTPTGKTFAGFAANGEPADPETGVVALSAPVAKNGRCPSILFDVGAEFVRTRCASGKGTWSVWLLDTRRTDGKPAGTRDGKPVLVNASGVVTAQVSATAGGERGDATAKAAASVDTPSAVPADAPQPVVTDLRLDGAWAYVTVTGTVSCLAYDLAAGEKPGETSGATAREPVQGADSATGEVILVKPRCGDREFLRPVRHPWGN